MGISIDAPVCFCGSRNTLGKMECVKCKWLSLLLPQIGSSPVVLKHVHGMYCMYVILPHKVMKYAKHIQA